jgi:hypothetical protein
VTKDVSHHRRPLRLLLCDRNGKGKWFPSFSLAAGQIRLQGSTAFDIAGQYAADAELALVGIGIYEE